MRARRSSPTESTTCCSWKNCATETEPASRGCFCRGGAHVHTNWSYDLYFLNHPKPWVRRTMRALCHVFTFPNQHHQHHSRTRNSARNMQNFLALYDWLLWKTLVIETKRPAVYGWKQQPHDARPLVRYLRRPLKVLKRTKPAAPRATLDTREASS